MLALLTIAFIANASAKPDILYDIEKEGVIMWQGRCTFLSSQYHCIMVKLKDDEYLVAGNMVTNGLDIKHIIRGGKNPAIVWSHTWVEI